MSDEGMKAITSAMQEVREKVGYVHKGGTNAHFKYSFAGEADFLRAIRPAMVEAGIMLLPQQRITQVDDKSGNVFVEISFTLAHRDGYIWPEKIIGIGCGNDRTKDGRDGDKAAYKSLTGAMKYALRHLFQIETGDDPEREEAPPPPRVPQPDQDVFKTCLSKVAEIESIDALKVWWDHTKEMLPSYDIVPDLNHPGGPMFLQIKESVKQRLLILQQLALPKPETPPSRAPATRTLPDDDIPF